ncbi:MAG: hypothetical protein ACRDJT_05920 [Actinomycetota bacterium]
MTPRVVAGGFTAVVAGGLMAALTASAGGLAGSLPGIVALTLTLVGAGAAFGWLVDTERLSGGFGSGILFWTAALPVARVAQEIFVGQGIPDGLVGFVVYQALVGGAFGLGFLLLHNQIAALLGSVRAKRAAEGRIDV